MPSVTPLFDFRSRPFNGHKTLLAGVVLAKKELKGVGALVLRGGFFLTEFADSIYGPKCEVPIIYKSYWLQLVYRLCKGIFAATLLAPCRKT